MWNHFSDINRSVPQVGKIIGGKVEANLTVIYSEMPAHSV